MEMAPPEIAFTKAAQDHESRAVLFGSFAFTWEQRRLGEVFDFIPNNTLSRAALSNESGDIQNVHYGDILVKYDSVLDATNDDIPFITEGNPNDYKKRILNNGDVLFADTAEDETVGKAVEVQGISDIPVVPGLHIMACRPKIKFAPNYLGYYINSPAYHEQLRMFMQGVKVLSISKANLSRTAVAFPVSEDEQTIIGQLFADLDRLITLHQREPCAPEKTNENRRKNHDESSPRARTVQPILCAMD